MNYTQYYRWAEIPAYINKKDICIYWESPCGYMIIMYTLNFEQCISFFYEKRNYAHKVYNLYSNTIARIPGRYLVPPKKVNYSIIDGKVSVCLICKYKIDFLLGGCKYGKNTCSTHVQS